MRTAFAVSSSLCCSHPSNFIHQRRQCRGKARRKNLSGIKGDLTDRGAHHGAQKSTNEIRRGASEQVAYTL